MTSIAIEKLSNAFIPDAMPADFIGVGVGKEGQRFLKTHRGLWVGGKVTINSNGLFFFG